MHLESVDHVQAAPLGNVERARDAMNAAFNAIAVDRTPETLTRDIELARTYVGHARTELAPLAGHEGQDVARAAARAVLPRLQHAMALLDALAVSTDPNHVTPLLDELGIAMDHVETVLAGAGWD